MLEGNLPSFEEYLMLGQITSTYDYLVPASFMGIGSTRKEDFEWLSEKPKILVSTLIIGRLLDDIGSYEVTHTHTYIYFFNQGVSEYYLRCLV